MANVIEWRAAYDVAQYNQAANSQITTTRALEQASLTAADSTTKTRVSVKRGDLRNQQARRRRPEDHHHQGQTRHRCPRRRPEANQIQREFP